MTAPAPALVVDMDGTLLRTDTLLEAALALLAAEPWRLAELLSWLRHGRAGFKARLAAARLARPETLPVNARVRAAIEAARAEGRRVELVSAADHRQAAAVAAHLGLFDAVHGTGGPGVTGNLSGARKAAFLVARFGRGEFDYMGDARADLAVWAEARRAITVGAGPALRAAAEATGEAEHLDPAPGGPARLAPLLAAMRPHQWLKNLLVFLPALAAHAPGAVVPSLLAFLCFGLTASSVYLLNDLLDLEADRAHPRKCRRPFASGTAPPLAGIVAAPALLAAAAGLALATLPAAFLGVLGLYYAATLAYSLVLKRKLVIDIWTLAGLYTLRILGGAAATGLALSPWMLGFSMFLFLALAAVKRQAELVDRRATGGAVSGRAWRVEDLPILPPMALAAGYAAVLVFALYIASPKVQELYSLPEALWAVCPLLLYWISRMVMVAHRGGMTDDPILFALRDRTSLATMALAGLAILAAWGLG